MIPFYETVKPYIIHYGYWAIISGVFLESMGLPLPGETLIIIAGLIAAKGMFNLTWVMALAVLATVVANNISYAMGSVGGRSLVMKYGHYVFMDQKKIKSLEHFVQRHGSKVLVVARFILGLRQFNGFIAGLAQMQLIKFEVYNILGALLWVGWWTGLAYCLGKKFAGIFIQCYFLFGVVSLVFFFILTISMTQKHKH